MSDERRTAKRHEARLPVKLRPTEGVTPYSQNAESVNISETGLLFQIDQPIAIGAHIELSFLMPGEVTGGLPMRIRCSARVVRVDTKGMSESKAGIAAHIERFETIVAEA